MGLWDKVRGVFGAGSAAPSSPPSSPKELFAAQVEAAVRQLRSVQDVRRNPDAFSLTVQRNGREQTAYLENVFAETRDMSPEQRQERIARFATSIETPDAEAMSWDEVRPKLAPLLRTPSLFAALPVPPDKQPLSRQFLPFIIECVGVDSDNGIAYVAPQMLEAWGVSRQEVFAAATDNARGFFTDDVAPYDAQAPYPLWHVARDDSYESSRLLVPGWLKSFEGKVAGRPVAIAPHRSLLVVGGDGDDRCLKRLVDTAKAEFEGSPRRISPALYTVSDDGRVIPLVLDPGHGLANDVALGHVLVALAEYEIQQKALQQRLGDEVYVGKFMAVKNKEGRPMSFGTWSRGVPSLLPQTDEVALVFDPRAKGGEVLRVPWRTLLDVVGDRIVPAPDVNPPRWRTGEWPTGEMLTKLRGITS
jgi:hypothetical protein